MSTDMYQKAAESIRNAKKLVIFTGAGMSADSGIETFRGSSNSLWSGFIGNIMLAYGGTPFGWNLTPGWVWSSFIKNFYQPIVTAKPHEGYYALTAINQELFEGKVEVITMNVDGFHQASGFYDNRVHEVHGTIRKFRCGKCSENIDIPNPTKTPVRCPHCSNGYARPDVTLFTENLPEEAWSNASRAVNRLKAGDVMLVIGTSSVVYPAAGIPERARENNAVLIEINPSETTPLKCEIHLKDGAAAALTKLADALGVDYRKLVAGVSKSS